MTTSTTRTEIRAVRPDAIARLCRAEGLGDEDDDGAQDLEVRIGELMHVAIVQCFVSDAVDGNILELADGRFVAHRLEADDVIVADLHTALAIFDTAPMVVDGVIYAREEFLATWRESRSLDTHYPTT